MAFTRALPCARRHPESYTKAFMLRYENAYAAMIASGTWKPKKHKDMAAEARQAWAGLNDAHSHPRPHSGCDMCEVAKATAGTTLRSP